MAIGFRGAGAFAKRSSPSTTALSVAVPTGTAAGDVMLLVAFTFVTTGSVPVDTPTGWTQIAATPAFLTNYRAALFWKVAGASEPAASVNTSTASYLEAAIVGFTGVDNSVPIDAAGSWLAVTNANPVVVPSITTVTANAWWVFTTVDAAIQLNASSVPSGWTQRFLSSGELIARAVINSVLVAAAGATTATSFPRTGTTNGYVSIGVALRPFTVAAPVANFTGTPLTGTRPLSVAFTDTSTNSPTSWAWTFGDGGTSTSQNPTHSYTSAGTYTVTLVATNAGGNDTKTRTGYVTVSNPSGTFTKIKWGDRLVVTDEGGGVIRVDFV